jgi:hypothetical protein
MDRKILLAAAFLFILNVAVGQRFDAGLIAGFNGTQVEGDALKGYHKAGILAGVFVQTDIAPAIIAGMEIKYSQKGARRSYDPDVPDVDQYIMRLDYVELPLFMGFRTNDRSMVMAGISPGYLLHSKELNSDGEIPEPDRQEFNSFDLQPFVGFRFDFLERASVDLRFALSVIPCSDKSETNYYFHSGLFNNVISLACYYNLGQVR